MRLAVFYENDTGAMVSLKQNARRLDGLIPQWLELRAARGEKIVENIAGSGEAYEWLKREAPGVKLYPLLQTTLPPRDAAMVLAVPALRASLVRRLADIARDEGFDGLTLDLSMAAAEPPVILQLVTELRQAMEPEGRKIIYVADGSYTEAEVASIAQYADYVLLPLQEREANLAMSTPIASQGWFEGALRSSMGLIPADKILVAIGSMATDWGPRGGKTDYSVQQAWDIADRMKAPIALHPQTLNSVFDYHDSRGDFHRMWLTDAVSVFNQARVALAASVGGLVLWRLGQEDQSVWEVIGKGKLPDQEALGALTAIEPGFGVFESAKGVLLSGGQGKAGKRTISYNPALGLILGQNIEESPKQAALVLWPALDPKSVALTFDDGPDPIFTPKILDILAERGAKATFYVLGQQVIKHPMVARRMLAEGHDIGNHSFSHPDLIFSSSERISAELSATQRVFEGVLGIRSALLRPPYAMTGFSYLETMPHVFFAASTLGYLFGGIDIDAFDYINWTPSQIAERVVRAVKAGDGNVVLLHDAGGERSDTIGALPLIIDELQAHGYHFVTTHELVGVPRDEMMPPYAPESFLSRAQAALSSVFVNSLMSLVDALPIVAIATALIGIARLCFIIIAAVLQTHRQRHVTYVPFEGSVTVLVPAFNEEKVICNTVRGLLTATVADKIVITVIDDGSKDRTADIVRETFPNDPRVQVLRKENGGKASALNYGIAQTMADVIVAIDGDTVLEPDAIEHLVAPFGDPTVGAVAGRVVVGNAINLITRFQSLEYIIGQNLERTAFSLFNAIGVVPGAIGAWRRTAVAQVGGYATDTLAEDADLTVAIERAGWRVVNANAAIALTEAPETLRGFLKQRFRWLFGTLQMAFKHKGALLERPSGVSLIILPNVALQFVFTLIAPLMDILALWVLVSIGLSLTGTFAPTDSQTLRLLVGYWALFQAVDILTAGVGLALNGDLRAWRLLPLVILQRVSYRQLLYFVAIRALLAALKGTFIGWGKLARTGRILKTAT